MPWSSRNRRCHFARADIVPAHKERKNKVSPSGIYCLDGQLYFNVADNNEKRAGRYILIVGMFCTSYVCAFPPLYCFNILLYFDSIVSRCSILWLGGFLALYFVSCVLTPSRFRLYNFVACCFSVCYFVVVPEDRPCYDRGTVE